MAKETYIGASSKARKVSKAYIGVDGVARKVKKGYIGDNDGLARLFFSGLRLGDLEPGMVVYLNENGSPIPFYVAGHDYASDINGTGRTLLVRKHVYGKKAWHSKSYKTFAESDIATWLNETYKATLDNAVQAAIASTSFQYTADYKDGKLATLSLPVFLLALSEFGKTYTAGDYYTLDEGAVLSAANILEIATTSSGKAVSQWTRTMICESAYVCTVLDDGEANSSSPQISNYHYYRPCFTLPADTEINEETYSIVMD